MNPVLVVLVLAAWFQWKHFLCDYPLQTSWMLGKGKGTGWVGPLAAHAGLHAAFTFAMLWVFLPVASALGLAIFDFGTHFVIDRVKAAPTLGGRWKPDSSHFWTALGADQMAHHLVHLYIVYQVAVHWGWI